MIDGSAIRDQLCRTFCSSISVNPVPSGFAVSSVFSDRSGDRIGFYLVETADGFRVEDDGDYLAKLVGSGVPIDQGQRASLLESILASAGASWDHDTYEIRSDNFGEAEIGPKLTGFLSALIRIRDLELLTREAIRSTFREDATSALTSAFGDIALFSENEAPDRAVSEFPADLVIHPKAKSSNIGALYFVTSGEKLSEALLLQMEVERLRRFDLKTVALIEDSEMKAISRKKFQRAQNRSLTMPIFRGDEDAAVARIGRDLGVTASLAG